MKSVIKEYINQVVISEQLSFGGSSDDNDFKTKQGEQISFKIKENSEPRENSLWIVHQITAYVNGNEAGYITISYIPHERVENFNLIDYLIQSGKRSLENYEQQPLWKQVETLILADFGRVSGDQLKNMSKEELLEIKKKKLEEYAEKYLPKMKDFLRFHVDKPLVDYIFVNEEQQRNRIGLSLYIVAAQWLAATKGLKLYASGIQSDKAQGAWAFMQKHISDHIGFENMMYNGKKKTRMFLSYL